MNEKLEKQGEKLKIKFWGWEVENTDNRGAVYNASYSKLQENQNDVYMLVSSISPFAWWYC